MAELEKWDSALFPQACVVVFSSVEKCKKNLLLQSPEERDCQIETVNSSCGFAHAQCMMVRGPCPAL